MTQTALQENTEGKLISTNPACGFSVLGEVLITPPAEIKTKVAKARAAQKKWYQQGLAARIQAIENLTAVLKARGDDFIRRTSQEMGMPLGLSGSIVDGAIAGFEWDCANAATCLASETLFEDDNEINELVYEPFGVVGCIVAWNFPLANFAVSVSQTLLAGNTVVMKYSEEIPLFCQFLETVIEESGFPADVINFIYGDGQTGAILTEQDVNMLSFTGSSVTGKKIYQQAAEKLIPVALELGGSSPGIVFEDMPVDDVLIEKLFWKRFLNTGQFCDGMKRLFVHENLFDDVVAKLAEYAKKKIIGDPLDEKVELGPLVAERQVLKLEAQLQDALDKGATLHCGGKRPAGLNGAYYEPTILSNITKNMKVWSEEVFGPVLPIIPFKTYDDAITLANETSYGLSAFVFTKDQSLFKKVVADIKAGSIDDGMAHFYRPQNPFGGYKDSGIGRQGGKIGFHDVCQKKVIARVK